jgi:hypothetical protein
VFVSFTLSQGGMARRHLRLREKGWKLGLLVNGLGAFSTLVVAAIIGVVKFTSGAWLIVAFVPLMVFLLVRMNRIYEAEEKDLLDGLGKVGKPLAQRHIAVVLVDRWDEKTFHAVQYAMTINPKQLIPVHLHTTESADEKDLARQWSDTGLPGVLVVLQCGKRGRAECLDHYLGTLAHLDAQITVIVPGPSRLSPWQRVRQGASWAALLRPLRDHPNVSTVVVREHGGHGHGLSNGRLRISPRPRHVAVILVDRLDRSILKAVRYARSIQAFDIRALHAGVDPQKALQLTEQWADLGGILGVPLDVTECFDRNIARTIREYIDEIKAQDAEITVVIPRREYPGLVQRFLHDRTSRTIARELADEPHVDIVVVPYRLPRHHHRPGTVARPEATPSNAASLPRR